MRGKMAVHWGTKRTVGHWPAEHPSSFGNAEDMCRLGTDQTSREYQGDPQVRLNDQPKGSVPTRKPHNSFGRFQPKGDSTAVL